MTKKNKKCQWEVESVSSSEVHNNMYPWYKEGHPISVSKIYSPPVPPLSNIKKETPFKDCMVSLDYSQNKVCRYWGFIQLNLMKFDINFKYESTCAYNDETVAYYN